MQTATQVPIQGGIQFDSSWSVAGATIALAIITYLYLRETKKIRLDAVEPKLVLEPDEYYAGSAGFNQLGVKNAGSPARNLRIECLIGEESKEKIFVPSLTNGEFIPLQGYDATLPTKGGIFKVRVWYQDIYNEEHQEELSIDFGKLAKEGFKIPSYKKYSLLEGIEKGIRDLARRR